MDDRLVNTPSVGTATNRGKVDAMQYWEDADQFHGKTEAHLCAVKVEMDYEGDLVSGLLMNPANTQAERDVAVEWAKSLLVRAYELGMDRAVEVDGWQTLRPGAWQLWGRPFEMPGLE